MVATRFEEAFMSAAFIRRFSSCSRKYHHSTVDHLLYPLSISIQRRREWSALPAYPFPAPRKWNWQYQ